MAAWPWSRGIRTHNRKGNSMTDNIVTFPGNSPEREKTFTFVSEPDGGELKKVEWRIREHVQRDIDLHIAARKAYGKAVAWEAAAVAENLPPAQIEEARR